jgi:hypothetical protein
MKRTHKCPKSTTNGNHIFEYYYIDGNFIGDAEDCKLCGETYGFDIDTGYELK